MDKLCCCTDSEFPTFSLHVTCACCQSKVDEHDAKDSTDFDMSSIEKEVKEIEKDMEEKVTCCFKICRKRHAKTQRDNETIAPNDGRDT